MDWIFKKSFTSILFLFYFYIHFTGFRIYKCPSCPCGCGKFAGEVKNGAACSSRGVTLQLNVTERGGLGSKTKRDASTTRECVSHLPEKGEMAAAAKIFDLLLFAPKEKWTDRGTSSFWAGAHTHTHTEERNVQTPGLLGKTLYCQYYAFINRLYKSVFYGFMRCLPFWQRGLFWCGPRDPRLGSSLLPVSWSPAQTSRR